MEIKNNYMKVIALLVICIVIMGSVLCLYGCKPEYTVQATNLMEGIKPNSIAVLTDLSEDNAKITDFAIRLFQKSIESGKNTLISPLSVLCALAMTANGAKGETLIQMESAFGVPVDELNDYLYSYTKSLSQGKKYKLSLANSIWFIEDENFTVKHNFLQKNADYYGADIYKAPFDKTTLKDINYWVNNKTDGMIPSILKDIPPETVMYLINALAFEAEWASIYKKNQVRDGRFAKEDGTKQDVEFMYSDERYYLEDEKAAGFIKHYTGQKYAFVAMLPNEGVSVSEYVQSLDGQALNTLFTSAQSEYINVAIPKFEIEYDVEMSEILASMGLSDAFNLEKADFTNMGMYTGANVFISRVIHKTFISVAEKGTKAGAATVVEMPKKSSIGEGGAKQIYLDRPFVYMLIDCENNIPFFIGTMMNI